MNAFFITQRNCMNDIKSQLCPCQSGKKYSDCCSPIHNKAAKAESCEQLMRSRFSAFVLQLGDYLFESYHEDYRGDLSVALLAEKTVDWKRLQIIATESLADKGFVEFKAWFSDRGQLHCHHERSNFVKDHDQWLYCDGIFYPEQKSGKIARNENCPCDSGKKYKRCCGK